MRFGIIGTNFISDWFAEAANTPIAGGEAAELAAVYSRKEETARTFAKKHGVKKCYTDYGQMLEDDEVDAVYVASPTFLHAEQSIRALNAGKHVLCEKMMAHDLSSFLLMRKAAKRQKKILLEAMRPDFDPAMAVIRDALSKIGRIRRVSFEFCQYSSRYDRFKAGEVLNAFDPSIHNSALADIGIYPLHMTHALFGKQRGTQAQGVFLENGFLGAGTILMDYGDFLATVTYSKITDGVVPSVIEGELGSLTLDRITAPSRMTLKLRGEEERVLDYTPAKNNMIYEIEAFADMVRGRREDAERYMDITELSQRTVDEVYRLTGAELGV